MRKTASIFGEHKNRTYSDVYITPPEILHPLGEFDMDPSAAINQPWRTATKMVTKEDDGLSIEWEGRVWLNPPYSQISSFMARMAAHNNGIALVFARTGTQWFEKYVWQSAHSILFLSGRITFYRESGVRAKSDAGSPSVLVAYGSQNGEALKKSTLSGHYLINKTN